MDMVVGWVAFPLVLTLLAIGCGGMLEYVSGRPLRGALLAPGGLAVLIVVAHPETLSEATAKLAVPVVVVVAVAGLVLARRRLRARIDPWAAGCALAVFAAYAAPVVLSGHAAIAGYVKLDDSASWLGLAAHLGHHGTSYAGLPPSTYEAMLDFYLGGHYPMGGLLPLTVGDSLLGTDGFELYQPFIAFLAAMLALCMYVVAERIIAPRWLRAVAVFLAAQAALLYGYGLWGGSKEVATAWLLALVAALFQPAVRDRLRGRALLPLAVAGAAMLALLSVGGGVWLVGFLVPALIIAVRREGGRAALRRLGVLAGLLALLAIPSLLSAGFLGSSAVPLSETSDRTGLANLIQPLSPLQALGIWPVGDFRLRPSAMAPTYVLLAVAAVAAAVGAIAAWRTQARTLLVYAGASAVGALIVIAFGTPWIDAKALAALSPALILMAMAGIVAVGVSGRRTVAALAAIAVAGGVLWSNLLGYHDVQLTPQARFAELEQIGHEIRGQGPTLTTEYEPYATRLFFRDADPEGASDLRRRPVRLRTGALLAHQQAADIDAFQLPAVLAYRTLVLRRSPFESRPPSVYRLTRRGRFYEVWRRGPGAIAEHLPLGGAPARCSDVLRLARKGRRLAYAPGPPTGGRIDVTAPGFTIPNTGPYEVWIGGTFGGRIGVHIDGKLVAARGDGLGYGAPFTSFATLELGAGFHQLDVERSASPLAPGSGLRTFPLTIAIVPSRDVARFATLPAANARTLCNRRLDWIEALR